MVNNCRFVSSAKLEGRLARFMFDMSKWVREDIPPSCDGRLLILMFSSERRSSELKPNSCKGNDEIPGL